MLERVNVLPGIDRIGAHTHIKTLGVNEDMSLNQESGFVGLSAQRRALFLLLKLCRNDQGRMVLLSGPPCTGKSALLSALVQELQRASLPCSHIAAGEVFSSTLSKVEILTQNARKAIGMQLQEKHKVIEGEVVSINIDRENPTVGKMTLKTTDAESIFCLSKQIIQALKDENIGEGDIIHINKSTGNVKKIGRSISRMKEHEVLGPALSILPTPEGELLSVREEKHMVTLHEIDMINTKNKGYISLLSAATEVPTEIRDMVDITMKEWIEEKRGTLATGILIIEEAHLLDAECHAFLNTVAELRMSPTIILCIDEDNKNMLPLDLLSRALLISTQVQEIEEIEKVVEKRAQEEGTQIEEKALQEIYVIAQEKGLRYALNILTAADALARRVFHAATPADIQFLVQIFPCIEI